MTYDVWKFYFIHSGCDDLLPILSFVIIRSGMAQLISECDAMEEFIPEGWVRGTFNYLRANELTGGSFWRNCGAVSVGEYDRVIWCYQLSWKRKLSTVKSLKADVSRVSPSSERLEELWVVCGFICINYWWEYGDEKQEYIRWMKSARWYRGDWLPQG